MSDERADTNNDRRANSERGADSPFTPSSWFALTLIAVGAGSAIGAVVAYWTGAGSQVFGEIVALSLFCGGAGLVAWAHGAMPHEPVTGEREPLESSAEERAEFKEVFISGEESIGRRRFLGASVLVFATGLFAVGVSMIRSLTPDPYRLLGKTPWRQGIRLVKTDGTPIKPNDLRIGGVLTVFPEGHVGDFYAQTLLIHVQPSKLDLPSALQSGAYQGFVAYSKVCTHAGCPVGLYEQKQQLLLCPCHQSTFDVIHGANPTSGPATRPLPQLPITVDNNGFLIAQSDFKSPTGPGYWHV